MNCPHCDTTVNEGAERCPCCTGSLTLPAWATVRSDCGRCRLTYHPEWSASQPWAKFVDGTAGRHYPNLGAALAGERAKGFRFSNEVPK